MMCCRIQLGYGSSQTPRMHHTTHTARILTKAMLIQIPLPNPSSHLQCKAARSVKLNTHSTLRGHSQRRTHPCTNVMQTYKAQQDTTHINQSAKKEPKSYQLNPINFPVAAPYMLQEAIMNTLATHQHNSDMASPILLFSPRRICLWAGQNRCRLQQMLSEHNTECHALLPRLCTAPQLENNRRHRCYWPNQLSSSSNTPGCSTWIALAVPTEPAPTNHTNP